MYLINLVRYHVSLLKWKVQYFQRTRQNLVLSHKEMAIFMFLKPTHPKFSSPKYLAKVAKQKEARANAVRLWYASLQTTPKSTYSLEENKHV